MTWTGSSTQLLVAYGSSALPAFRILDIPTLSSQPLGDADHEAPTIILKAAGGALLLSPNTTQQSGEQDSTMDNAGALPFMRTAAVAPVGLQLVSAVH
ncbi:hypothetical protein HaLaN_18740 [Haematococcus lacustris]|uniref:Uncharacterized protein n=1 Tax=Haematococcus lacustris TaxID=44745 RepID=A0A699ZFU2_HAELA|nr:hypothetical protein HaLaN_18740 [Haematococcus lacustris]